MTNEREITLIALASVIIILLSVFLLMKVNQEWDELNRKD